jgi:tripartite ATP-independent transporter DctP family solute receptor
MMRIKKGLAVLSSLVLATSVFLTGCGATQSVDNSKPQEGTEKKEQVVEAQKYTIKVANYFATDHPQNVALREKFKPMVEEKSGGTLTVEIFDNSQLGAEKEFYDGVRNGTIEMGIPGMIMQADIPKLAVGEWPFLFKDYDHVKKVLTGPIGEELTADLESIHGVKALAWSANGFRMFSTNKTLDSIDDFKGLRLRMPNIPNYIKLGQLLGANVTPLPFSEVFTGLEQKVVDGQDNPIATVKASGWYEVQSDILESRHMFSPNLYIINSNFWNKLSPEQQQAVQESATASATYEWELMEKSYEEDKKFLEEKGLKFTPVDDAYRTQLQDAVKPLYDEIFGQHDWAEDMVNRIKAEAE